MKKRFSILIPLSGFFLFAILLSACIKNHDKISQNAVAGLMAFNLAPDQPSVGVNVSGKAFTTEPLGYTSFTGNYRSVNTGNQKITTYEFASQTPLADTSQLFEDSAFYSVFFVGANGKYKNIITKDNFDSLTSASGQAFVRYVDAIPDSSEQPIVTIASNGINVFSDVSSFASVSGFKGIAPGNIAINVNAESGLNASRTIAVEQGKIYTILLVGQPQSTDSTKAVQIKFIQNGNVTP